MLWKIKFDVQGISLNLLQIIHIYIHIFHIFIIFLISFLWLLLWKFDIWYSWSTNCSKDNTDEIGIEIKMHNKRIVILNDKNEIKRDNLLPDTFCVQFNRNFVSVIFTSDALFWKFFWKKIYVYHSKYIILL